MHLQNQDRVKIWIIGLSMTCDYIQVKIKMPNPSQEHPASTKSPIQDLKDMDVLYIIKTKIEIQNWENWCIKDQWPYQNQYQDAKP